MKATDDQVGGNHYKDCGIQPIEYIQANGLSYLEGNVIKYVTRHSSKNQEQDIKKAIHYLKSNLRNGIRGIKMKKVILAGLMSAVSMGVMAQPLTSALAEPVECSDATLMVFADDYTVVHAEVQQAGAATVALINYMRANMATMSEADRGLLQIQINESFDRGFKAQADLLKLQDTISNMCGPDAVAKVIMASGL